MANFSYTRRIGQQVHTSERNTFLEIAELAMAERESKIVSFFGTIEGVVEGRYVRWDDGDVVRSVIDIICKALAYQHVLTVKTAEEKNRAFLVYVQYEGVRLDPEKAAYPWCPTRRRAQ